MATILTKKKDTTGAPSAGDLTNSSGGAELAVNTADKRLYTKDSGGTVVELGTNPTDITTGTVDTTNLEVTNIKAKDGTAAATIADSTGKITVAGQMTIDGIEVGQGAGNVATNTAVGASALAANEAGGTNNTAVGYQALDANTTGDANTAVGDSALGTNTTATSNTAVGYRAGFSITTGNDNCFIGKQTGESQVAVTTGGQNTFIGSFAGATSTSAAQYQISIGYNVQSAGDLGYVTIGDGTGANRIYCNYASNATWTRVSDARIKKDIQDSNLGLEFINKLRVVTYKKRAPSEMEPDFPFYDAKDNNPRNDSKLHGFIAQEVKQALNEVGETEFNGWHQMENGVQGVSYEMFVMPLIKAVQELSAQVEELKSEVNTLKGN